MLSRSKSKSKAESTMSAMSQQNGSDIHDKLTFEGSVSQILEDLQVSETKTMSTSNGSYDDVERRPPSPVIVEDASEDASDEEGYPSMSMRTSSRHTATDEFSPQSAHSSNSHSHYHKPAQSSFDDIQNARSADSGRSHNSQYSGAGGNNRYVQTNFSNNSNIGRSSYQDAENTPAFSNASSSHIHRGGSSSFQQDQDQNMNTPAYSNVSANNVNRSYSHASRGSRGSNKTSSSNNNNRRTKTAAPTPAPTPKVTEAPSMSSIKFKMVSESPPAKIGPFCGCF